jgi:hypothetical protein
MQLCLHWIRLSVLIALVVPMICFAQATGDREVQLESTRTSGGTLFDALGLSRPEFGGLRLSAFVVGSFSYNSRLQLVPEFAGAAPALADPGSTSTRLACGSRKPLRRGSRRVPRLKSRTIATGTATASILSLAALALACV